MTLQERISKIPGSDGWWKDGDTFQRIANNMSKKGIDDDTIVNWLTEAHNAVAEEYGE